MKKVLFSAVCISILFSCKKSSEDKVPAQPSQQDLLGKYKITRLLFQSKGNADQDLLATLPGCAQDNLLVFAPERSGCVVHQRR